MEPTQPLATDPIDYLRSEFQSRQARRSAYSLRAFARDLDLSPSTLSELLSRKVGLSPAMSSSLAKRLKLPSPHDEHFCDLVAARHSRSTVQKNEAKIRASARLRASNSNLSLDKFRIVSDWYHMAILELVELDPQYHSVKRLSEALGVAQRTIKEGLERLVKVGELELSESGWRTVSSVTLAGERVPSEAIRRFHSEVLEKAALALHSQSLDQREFQTSFFCISEADLPELKKDLSRMGRELIKKYGHKPDRKSLYALSLQLFSLMAPPTEKR